jgi:hypothetical protein
VFLTSEGQVTGYLHVVRVQLTPMGALVRCHPEPHRLPTPIPEGSPADIPRREWRWRWWPQPALKEHRP